MTHRLDDSTGTYGRCLECGAMVPRDDHPGPLPEPPHRHRPTPGLSGLYVMCAEPDCTVMLERAG